VKYDYAVGGVRSVALHGIRDALDRVPRQVKSFARNGLRRTGYDLARLPSSDHGLYNEDGLVTGHNHEFMLDRDFLQAYERGVAAAGDPGWRWRVHVGLWAARTAVRLPGDFVECGVNRGFLSTAIMEFLDWNRVGKGFWLFDTFSGIDLSLLAGEELEQARRRNEQKRYADVKDVRLWFSQWRNAHVIEGPVPGTLTRLDSERVAYLHLDMNASTPEVAALRFLWDRLVPGAVVLLDDYAYAGYEPQKHAMDEFAKLQDVAIASLPTGQGLLLRPPGP
jgi:hypothetical protein